MKTLINKDFQKNQAQNVAFQLLSAAPFTPVLGQFYYDTVIGGLGTCTNATGPVWYYYIISLHSLSEMAAPTGDIPWASHKITGLANGVSAQDAVTVSQLQAALDAALAGISSKDPVAVVATTNVSTTSAPSTIDSYTLVALDRVLLTGQTTNTQNGVWVFASAGAAMTRANDSAQNNEMNPGALWLVLKGTANAGSKWRMATTGTIVVGTTAISIVQDTISGTAYTGSNGVVVTGTVISIDITLIPKVYQALIPQSGTLTSISMSDGMAAKKKHAQVFDASTDQLVECDINVGTSGVTIVGFAVAPANNAYYITVIGISNS